MRIATIALLGSVFLLPAAPPAMAGSATASVETGVTVMISAQTEKKAKPKKAKKEKIEYMKSAAPPEPKK